MKKNILIGLLFCFILTEKLVNPEENAVMSDLHSILKCHTQKFKVINRL